jgi:hypothetical protein
MNPVLGPLVVVEIFAHGPFCRIDDLIRRQESADRLAQQNVTVIVQAEVVILVGLDEAFVIAERFREADPPGFAIHLSQQAAVGLDRDGQTFEQTWPLRRFRHRRIDLLDETQRFPLYAGHHFPLSHVTF